MEERQGDNMALTKLSTDLNNITALVPEPNDVGGLTAPTLQSRFDKAGNDIKTYINSVLTTETDSAIADAVGAGRTTETVKGAYDALATHKLAITGDHDGRYYTETEIDSKVNILNNADTAQVNALTAHRTGSADHDSRYYNQAVSDAKYETISDLTANRKLSASGDFTGTIAGMPITSTDPGLSIAFNAYKAETATFVSAFKEVGDPDDALSFTRALAFVDTKGGGRVRVPWRIIPYVLSTTPLIYSNTHLEVDEFAQINLATDVNCRMLENANKTTQVSLTRVDKNIKVTGGIWNGNGPNQTKKWDDAPNTSSLMTGFLFSGVDRFTFLPTKIMNTKTYGTLICNVNDLLIENVEVDVGNVLVPNNGDGIHILGPAERVTIKNCMLHSEDNVIAINADDIGHGPYGTFGDITTVRIKDIYINNYDGGQGMLLLSGDHAVKDVVIEGITGKAKYLVAVTTYDFGLGDYDDITIKDITLDQIDSAYHFITLCGKMGTVNLKNLTTDGYINTAGTTPIGIHAFATVSTPCSIENLNIDGVDMGGMDGLDVSHYIVYIDNQVSIGNLSVHDITSKFNAKPCVPLHLFQCTVGTITLSKFNIDHAVNGGISILDSPVSKINYKDIVLDSTSVNEFHYVNNSVADIGEVHISNCGNVNVLASNKITNLTVDNQAIRVFTPIVMGATSSGTATYSVQDGKYTQTGKVVNLQVEISWSGHTGTGQLFIPLPLPLNSSNIGYVPVSVVSSGIAITGKMVGLINKNTSMLQLYAESGGSFLALNVPASGTLYVAGAYGSD